MYEITIPFGEETSRDETRVRHLSFSLSFSFSLVFDVLCCAAPRSAVSLSIASL